MNKDEYIISHEFIQDLQIHGIAEAKCRELIVQLNRFFKGNMKKYYPELSTHSNILKALYHSCALERLQGFEGFEDHLKEYDNSFASAFFVALVADYFVRRNCKVALEPKINGGNGKMPDIKVDFGAGFFYVECKNPTKDVVLGNRFEQIAIFDAFYNLLNKYPCQLCIEYSNAPEEEELARIVAAVENKMQYVTGIGQVYARGDFVVTVTIWKNPPVLDFTLAGAKKDETFIMLGDYEAKGEHRIQISFLSKNGVGASLAKRDVDVLSNIQQQMKNAKKKALNHPVYLAINSRYMVGRHGSHASIIAKMFNENNFTSLSGVILAGYSFNFSELIKADFELVSNPFAIHPVAGIGSIFIPVGVGGSEYQD